MFSKNLVDESTSLFSNISHLIDLLLKEQRHQRHDLQSIIRRLDKLINEAALQKHVTDFYDDNDDRRTEAEGSLQQV